MKDIFKIRRISLYALYLSILLFLIGGSMISSGNNTVGLVIGVFGVLLFLSFIILGIIYWRCPFCYQAFELRHGKMDNINICPFCGKKLRD